MENLTNVTTNSTAGFDGLNTDYPSIMAIDKYVTPIICLIGIPGNILSFVIWMQRRMRHSSGYYLAALALDDLIFLTLHIVFEIHVTWSVSIVDYPVLCETYPILFIASQYLSPFFVLGFTTERYISICHPFKREKYCTIKRAKIVIVCFAVFMLCLTAPHGYFFTMESSVCEVRLSVREGHVKSIYNLYNLSVEMLAFFVVPVAVLVLNILVILELRRLSRVEQAQLHGSPQRTAATTVMLLAVSFYQIITTLPVSITYALQGEFEKPQAGDPDYDRFNHSHMTYNFVQMIIKEYGITHYAFNFIIYVITGKMFRQELKRLLLRPFSKLALHLPRDYTSLRTSVRASENSRTWVSTNGNHAKEIATSETLL
ncbi:unnamed protein product [Lymnaea stagnalis]|uniref:G-protein coupled receptors family 1 profile domain-containing protein n=1 Tax=Lymnaea stagnalis TaxID=6523 RepID=A0AAV2HNZ4_LYMST